METSDGTPGQRGRDRILARIRAALVLPAPRHKPLGVTPQQFFAPVEDLAMRFQVECAGNHTECLVVKDGQASAAALLKIFDSLPTGEVYVQDEPDLRSIQPRLARRRPLHWSSEPTEGRGGPREGCAASVTKAEVLVANTGSVFVSAACGGRSASMSPPVHIVIAGAEQLAPTLDAAFARLRANGAIERSSSLCLITGSSRTADIEKILVLGAHGPRRLVVILALAP